MKSTKRPLIFVDLDDTLFQTERKMPAGAARHVASYDINGKPSGYMSDVQRQFVTWLLSSADVVPVTARSVEVFQRVDIPFEHGAICSHGAVILDANGQKDASWHESMQKKLEPFATRLGELSSRTLNMGGRLDMDLRGWVVTEYDMPIYVVTKHNKQTDDVLTTLRNAVELQEILAGMYVHQNANNLAFLPDAVNKKYAVQEWLKRDLEENGERPVLGFGDSLSDLGFMDSCHWWATPSSSQIAQLGAHFV